MPSVRGRVARMPGPGIPLAARRPLRLAWVSVALVPLGLVAAMLVGEGLLSTLGFESGVEQAPPFPAVLIAGVPAMVILVLPAVGAIVFGFVARSRGAVKGVVPAVIGIVVAAYFVIANLLPWLLGSGAGP